MSEYGRGTPWDLWGQAYEKSIRSQAEALRQEEAKKERDAEEGEPLDAAREDPAERNARGRIWSLDKKRQAEAETAGISTETERRYRAAVRSYARKWPGNADTKAGPTSEARRRLNRLPEHARELLRQWADDEERRAEGKTEYAAVIRTEQGNEIFLLTKRAERISAKIENALNERPGRAAGRIMDQRTERAGLNALYKEAVEAANRAARRAERTGKTPKGEMTQKGSRYRKAGGRRKLPAQQERALRGK